MNPLDFPIIAGDDTPITAGVTNKYAGGIPTLAGATAQVTVNDAVTGALLITILNADISINTGTGSLSFIIPGTATSGLAEGYYPWKAVITLVDGQVKTYNNGDTNSTTGHLHIVRRP